MSSDNGSPTPSSKQRGRRWAHLRDSLRQSLGLVMVGVWTALGTPKAGWWHIGAILAVAGILIRLWASGHIKKNKILATDGPYGYVRHPLYVGNFLIAVGFAAASGLWWAWLMLVVFWLIFYPNAIHDEDTKLERLFGDAWRHWAAKTKALIPRFSAYRDTNQAESESNSWSFGQSLRSNGEPVIVVLLLACLYLLYRWIA